MISKELLSLVLGEEVTHFRLKSYVGKHNIDDCLEIGCSGVPEEYCYELNLDTLTRLCKEWCYQNNHIIQSKIVHKNKWKYIAEIYYIVNDAEGFSSHFFRAYTELEAVIKATEWVVKEKL